MALMQRGRCTGRELAALVGRWTWCMLVARPALACLAAVYRFMKAAGDRLFWLWPSVRAELLLVARIAPLLSACLSSDWFPGWWCLTPPPLVWVWWWRRCHLSCFRKRRVSPALPPSSPPSQPLPPPSMLPSLPGPGPLLFPPPGASPSTSISSSYVLSPPLSVTSSPVPTSTVVVSSSFVTAWSLLAPLPRAARRLTLSSVVFVLLLHCS